MKAKAAEAELQFDTQAEGHGWTRFDANIVTLSGRVVSKELEKPYRGEYGPALESECVSSFVLNVVRNGYGACRVANVLCRVQDGKSYRALAEGDMIAVVGELDNTKDGKGLCVKVRHWHLLEPHEYRQGKQNIAGANETQEGTASEAK